MILDDVIFNKRQEVTALKLRQSLSNLDEELRNAPKPRDFYKAISQGELSLIAELKKASPSAGVIRQQFEPVSLAKMYEGAGAHAISVLTDKKFFQGELEHLRMARSATKLPILRKDFIIDESQIYESRIAGADAILLIVSVISDEELEKFLRISRNLKMDCLVEVHTPGDAERALKSEARIIGINNRDLKTFKVNFNTIFDLIARFPKLKERTIVSESGIKSKENVRMLKEKGVNAVLIGEALLKSKDIEGKIRELLGA